MVTVVGIVPFDAPKIAEVAPLTLIRRTPHLGPDDLYVEHVRLSSPIQKVLLPSIQAKVPSKLLKMQNFRDASECILKGFLRSLFTFPSVFSFLRAV